MQTLESQSGWKPAVNGWEGAEGRLQLTGWTASRRVIELRRKRERPAKPAAERALGWAWLAHCGLAPEYEHQVRVTNLTEELLTVSNLHRQRADAENVYDERKNQWAGASSRPGICCAARWRPGAWR